MSRQGASYDMQHDLVRSLGDLDLRSTLPIDLSRSCDIPFDSSRREKHDSENSFALTIKRTKLFVRKKKLKNILEFGDLWRPKRLP